MKKFEEYKLNELNKNIDGQISEMLFKSFSHIENVEYVVFNTRENRCEISIGIKGSNIDEHLKNVKHLKEYFNKMFNPLIEKISASAGQMILYFEIDKKECENFNLYQSLAVMNSFNI